MMLAAGSMWRTTTFSICGVPGSVTAPRLRSTTLEVGRRPVVSTPITDAQVSTVPEVVPLVRPEYVGTGASLTGASLSR